MKLFLCFLSCILYLNLSAQKLWSLDNCISYAVANNLSVRQAEIARQAAESGLSAARAAFLPDLNASAVQNWNFGRTQVSSGLYENQTQSNSGFSASASVPLYAGGRLVNSVAKAKLDLQAAFYNTQKAKNDMELQVTSLFFQVLLQKEILKIAQNQYLFTAQQIGQTAALVQSGKVPSSQAFDIAAQASRDTLAVVQAAGNVKLALLDLAQILELQDIEGFDIIAPEISQPLGQPLRSDKNIYNIALTARAEIKSAELGVQSAEKSLKITQSNYYPSISFSAGVSTNYFYLYTKNFSNTDFSSQIKNNLGEYVGFNLNIPIFNRLSSLNQSRQAKLNIENQKLFLENIKKQIFKEIQTAYLNVTLAEEKQRTATQAVASAQEAFRYATERYRSGKSSVFELSQAQSRLWQAQSELVQAKYDYMLKIKILEFYQK
jgi:outer membrane protein